MSSIKVSVLYKGTEKSMDIEINEDNLYNSFLDIFRQKFNEYDPLRYKFKLISINTNIPYLLVDEYNISNIIKEKIPNGDPLKLLLTKEDNIEDIKRESSDDSFYCGYIKKGIADEEDFNDDDFMALNEKKDIEKEKKKINENDKEEKEKEEKINKILSNSFSKEYNKNNENEINNNNLNKIKEEKKDKIIDNENDIENLNLNENLRLSYLSNDSGNININSMIIDNNKNKDKEVNSQKNKVDEKNEDNNNKSILPVNELNIPKNVFNNEICTLCKKTLSSFKFICSICENCSLCEKCEDIHIHPCFKYKTTFLSDIKNTYKYIDRNYNYKIPIDSKKMTKLIRKEYNLKIVPMTDHKFIVPPNKMIDIPVKILNLSDHEVNSSQFIIIIKNNLLINISYQVDKIFTIKPNEEYELRLLCRTPAIHSMERINIEIYSAELNIRMSSRLSFDLEIEINDDKEDETLNNQLNNDKYAIFHTKEHKQVILSMLYYKDEWKHKLRKVCQVLRDNKFDTKKSIEILTKKKKK